jgi:hypothetical protein
MKRKFGDFPFIVDPEETFTADEYLDLWSNIPEAVDPSYKVFVRIDPKTDPEGRQVILIPRESLHEEDSE